MKKFGIENDKDAKTPMAYNVILDLDENVYVCVALR